MHLCLPGLSNRLAAWLLAMQAMRSGRRAWLRWDGSSWGAIDGDVVIE
jgi:hypothetical protein